MATRPTTLCFLVLAAVLSIVPFCMYRLFLDKTVAPHLYSKEQFVASSDILHFQKGNFSVNQEDSLIRHIKGRIAGPSLESYNLQNHTKRYYSQVGQDKFVDDTLHQLQGGFFVECGAADGEFLSNTMFLERFRNWTGLLIEANPYFYSTLLEKQRKAYTLNACLSLENVPKLMKFKPIGLLGGIAGSMDETHLKAIKNYESSYQDIEVQCFPFHYIMEALGRNHINYLSLDVEGPELEILETIPWEKIRIDVISVEYRLWDGRQINFEGGKMKLNRIRKLMLDTALYEEAEILTNDPDEDKDGAGLDVIFNRRDLNV